MEGGTSDKFNNHSLISNLEPRNNMRFKRIIRLEQYRKIARTM